MRRTFRSGAIVVGAPVPPAPSAVRPATESAAAIPEPSCDEESATEADLHPSDLLRLVVSPLLVVPLLLLTLYVTFQILSGSLLLRIYHDGLTRYAKHLQHVGAPRDVGGNESGKAGGGKSRGGLVMRGATDGRKVVSWSGEKTWSDDEVDYSQ